MTSIAPPPPPLSESNLDQNMLFDGIGRGTPSYTAPEIYTGRYSLPVDIYSLGVSLYVIMTGINPFPELRSPVMMMIAIKKGFFESGEQVDPSSNGMQFGVSRFLSGELIPRKACDLIRRMVSRDPLQRPVALQVYECLIDIEQDFNSDTSVGGCEGYV